MFNGKETAMRRKIERSMKTLVALALAFSVFNPTPPLPMIWTWNKYAFISDPPQAPKEDPARPTELVALDRAAPEPEAAPGYDTVAPGRKYLRLEDGEWKTACSAGFLVADRDTGRIGFLTAGHCDPRTDALFDENGDCLDRGSGLPFSKCSVPKLAAALKHGAVPIGGFAAGWMEKSPRVKGKTRRILFDGALIDAPQSVPMSSRVDGRWPIGPTFSTEEITKLEGSKACKFGATTGLTCGTIFGIDNGFVRIDDWEATEDSRLVYFGDSGGPVFVFENGYARPLGVTTHGAPGGSTGISPNVLFAQPIEPLLRLWNLELVTE